MTVYTLTDSVHGNLSGRGTCALPRTISPLAAYQYVVATRDGEAQKIRLYVDGKEEDSAATSYMGGL